VAEKRGEVFEITPRELQQRLDTGEPLVLLDVREPAEWAIANLGPQGARLLPMAELPDALDELDRAADVVLYCHSGGRSGRAAQWLAANGFTRVYNLAGGITRWARDVDPTMPTY
jgi:adenylyltransferase/sulfurtransferase